jgi:hypothetical protein
VLVAVTVNDAVPPLAIVWLFGSMLMVTTAPPPPPPPPLPPAPADAAGNTRVEDNEPPPVPTEFVAATRNRYPTPFVSPLIVIGLEAPVAVPPPGNAVTVYEVIGLPPFEAGGEKLTVACPSPATAVTFDGASGKVAGTTALDGAELAPVPTAFVAVTVNV